MNNEREVKFHRISVSYAELRAAADDKEIAALAACSLIVNDTNALERLLQIELNTQRRQPIEGFSHGYEFMLLRFMTMRLWDYRQLVTKLKDSDGRLRDISKEALAEFPKVENNDLSKVMEAIRNKTTAHSSVNDFKKFSSNFPIGGFLVFDESVNPLNSEYTFGLNYGLTGVVMNFADSLSADDFVKEWSGWCSETFFCLRHFYSKLKETILLDLLQPSAVEVFTVKVDPEDVGIFGITRLPRFFEPVA